MTEAEWLACDDARSMVLSGHLPSSARKLRLFAVGCCRCSRQLIRNAGHRQALEVAERFAEGLATEEELTAVHRRANELACQMYAPARSERAIRRWAEATAVASATTPGGDPASDAVWQINRATADKHERGMASLLRDMFCNPFRLIERDPAWLLPVREKFGDAAYNLSGLFHPRWLTPTVLALAEGVYSDRAFDRMPILAHALQDAGCDHPDILAHCRSEGPHVRGCWVVDLVLAKP